MCFLMFLPVYEPPQPDPCPSPFSGAELSHALAAQGGRKYDAIRVPDPTSNLHSEFHGSDQRFSSCV
jgi:hypothetical protein